MFTYLLALLPILFFFSDPIARLFSPSPPQIRRLPRPQLNEDLLALESDNFTDASNYTCPPDTYTAHIFSRAPLVVYIENFLSADERSHILQISTPLYTPSTITHNGGDTTVHTPSVRDSEVALLPRTGPVRCVENRARSLQGWRDEVWIERLRAQRYKAGGHYAHHFDWSGAYGGWGRVGSMMVWVAADGGGGDGGDGEKGGLDGGGTEFPLLKGKEDGRWCRFVECAEEAKVEEEKKGVVFKPVPGNAVYWENFMADGTGRGFEETWHAGLPVKRGVKVGLNIWSWGRID